MPDITYDVGRVSFVMKGAWNLATSYEKLDAVSYNGSLYIAKQDVPGGTAITNTTYWQLAAEKGDQGETGGVDSVNGQQGDIWFPDSRQLISDGYTTDTEPFLMKGNDSDSDRFELAKKLGNTVAVNQLAEPRETRTVYGMDFTNNDDGTATLVGESTNSGPIGVAKYLYVEASHKYLAFGDGKTPRIITGETAIQLTFEVVSGETYNEKFRPITIDLTLWYGSNDRIPSDLLSHPENWGRYYAGSLDYNAGTLESADGTILNSIGRNLFDGEWESGYYDAFDGTAKASGAWQRNKNPIPYVATNSDKYFAFQETSGGSLGYFIFYDAQGNFLSSTTMATGIAGTGSAFTVPANTHHINMYRGKSNDGIPFTMSIYYPGESGYSQTYPHSVLAEVDTGSEALRSAGAVADEKTPDGTITRRVGVYTFSGSESWVASSTPNRFSLTITAASMPNSATPPTNANAPQNLVTARYGRFVYVNADHTAYAYAASGSTVIVVNDTSISTAAGMATAMAGQGLYYELATPTTEQGTAFDPLVVTVKGGVLSWTNTKGIPVGHESHWFENLRKRVEDRLPDPPSADGTYRLTCTISGGVKTYSWEA